MTTIKHQRFQQAWIYLVTLAGLLALAGIALGQIRPELL
jgi:hypothetical protein